MAATARPITMAHLRGRMVHTRFWAERGMVCFERKQHSIQQHDEYQQPLLERDGEYGQMTVASAEYKLREVQQMLHGAGTLDLGLARDRQEKRDVIRFCYDMRAVIDLAREQGTYDDPTALRDYALRAPKSLFIPGQDTRESAEVLVPGINC